MLGEKSTRRTQILLSQPFKVTCHLHLCFTVTKQKQNEQGGKDFEHVCIRNMTQ